MGYSEDGSVSDYDDRSDDASYEGSYATGSDVVSDEANDEAYEDTSTVADDLPESSDLVDDLPKREREKFSNLVAMDSSDQEDIDMLDLAAPHGYVSNEVPKYIKLSVNQSLFDKRNEINTVKKLIEHEEYEEVIKCDGYYGGVNNKLVTQMLKVLNESGKKVTIKYRVGQESQSINGKSSVVSTIIAMFCIMMGTQDIHETGSTLPKYINMNLSANDYDVSHFMKLIKGDWYNDCPVRYVKGNSLITDVLSQGLPPDTISGLIKYSSMIPKLASMILKRLQTWDKIMESAQPIRGAGASVSRRIRWRLKDPIYFQGIRIYPHKSVRRLVRTLKEHPYLKDFYEMSSEEQAAKVPWPKTFLKKLEQYTYDPRLFQSPLSDEHEEFEGIRQALIRCVAPIMYGQTNLTTNQLESEFSKSLEEYPMDFPLLSLSFKSYHENCTIKLSEMEAHLKFADYIAKCVKCPAILDAGIPEDSDDFNRRIERKVIHRQKEWKKWQRRKEKRRKYN